MTFQGLNGEHYKIGRELGRGGEGQVFDVDNHTGIVVKRYNEPLQAVQVSKLKLMVSLRDAAVEAYAAWPRDLAIDVNGMVCGFVMRKLTGFVPLHMLFSPMDRKKMFPDKGYNFLLHVARNLATAFHKLHEAGLVVGDVNEGNILISKTGLVAFIDCDSFQVKGDNNYFYCEVGVPRYTPPELLSLGSFNNVVRTVNTDSFSLAILIFQLLFMGRHPFAGVNNTRSDIDEETAIRQRWFAYSLSKQKRKLTPPKDSFSITNLSDGIVNCFHQAFETDERPQPAEWVRALDIQLADISTCMNSGVHTYPAKMSSCPWCAFRESRGILYFLDDTYIKASAVTDDIDSFVNGFKVEQLQLPFRSRPQHIHGVATAGIPAKFKLYANCKLAVPAVASITLFFSLFLTAFNIGHIVLAIVVLWLVIHFMPFEGWLKEELERLDNTHYQLLCQLDAMIREFNFPPEYQRYQQKSVYLSGMVARFRQLPEEYNEMKTAVEEQLYNEQLGYFLAGFRIENYDIPSIGNVRKEALTRNGITTAADISLLGQIKVPGIGPKNHQLLLSWQRQMSSGFTYFPDFGKIAAEVLKVNTQFNNIKMKLEAEIRVEYRSLTYMKANISNRAALLDAKINEVARATFQAEIDWEEFRKFVGT